jgi:hypothetical protein
VHDGLGLAGQLESRETIQQLAEEQRGHQPDELARYTHVRPEAEGEMLLVLVPPNAEALRVREPRDRRRWRSTPAAIAWCRCRR